MITPRLVYITYLKYSIQPLVLWFNIQEGRLKASGLVFVILYYSFNQMQLYLLVFVDDIAIFAGP